MLIFDSKGNLKPYQPIVANMNDLKKYFVDDFDSDTRKLNYEKYIIYTNDLKVLLGEIQIKQWVNGSFVTNKKNPKDIDVVTFIDHSLIKYLGSKLDVFKAGASWTSYGIDAYIIEVYPLNNKLYKFTQYDIIEWQDLFSHTKLNRKGQKYKKGFLEIIY